MRQSSGDASSTPNVLMLALDSLRVTVNAVSVREEDEQIEANNREISCCPGVRVSDARASNGPQVLGTLDVLPSEKRDN